MKTKKEGYSLEGETMAAEYPDTYKLRINYAELERSAIGIETDNNGVSFFLLDSNGINLALLADDMRTNLMEKQGISAQDSEQLITDALDSIEEKELKRRIDRIIR